MNDDSSDYQREQAQSTVAALRADLLSYNVIVSQSVVFEIDSDHRCLGQLWVSPLVMIQVDCVFNDAIVILFFSEGPDNLSAQFVTRPIPLTDKSAYYLSHNLRVLQGFIPCLHDFEWRELAPPTRKQK